MCSSAPCQTSVRPITVPPVSRASCASASLPAASLFGPLLSAMFHSCWDSIQDPRYRCTDKKEHNRVNNTRTSRTAGLKWRDTHWAVTVYRYAVQRLPLSSTPVRSPLFPLPQLVRVLAHWSSGAHQPTVVFELYRCSTCTHKPLHPINLNGTQRAETADRQHVVVVLSFVWGCRCCHWQRKSPMCCATFRREQRVPQGRKVLYEIDYRIVVADSLWMLPRQ